MPGPRSFEPFPAAAGIDRSADERRTEGLVETLRAETGTRVLVLQGDAAPLRDGGGLHLVPAEEVPAGAEWAFLGRDAARAGVLAAVFPSVPEQAPPLTAPAGWGALRAVGGDLDGTDSGLFVEALSLGRWLLDAAFCPFCGTRTELRNAGWSRKCPHCGREHFPRTDPAVIVAVGGSQHPDRLLLGANAMWGGERFSCFAGFAEAGESLESTVAREVFEEAGVELVDVRYRGSQAWPYPRSLMLGFHATAADEDAARPDGEEIVAVRWFTRDEIGAGLAGEGGVLLPGPASIARRLIADWHTAAG
ncbi:NADH pyrophosphatase [Microbacterium lemovicicum]|uniref:NAD(+) diphosphatase n=1 Tax=Microbacterium lemovicicum TaxID=1072463 RepID=A0A3S9WAZ8_9MICO|nr:NAD(+) diphosphatase [Microbacterium lemovicicum]AZS37195.1 NADH pyrophosphatase [Microbacterium lemovicicum]